LVPVSDFDPALALSLILCLFRWLRFERVPISVQKRLGDS